jgi:hypothetical protein
MDVLLSVAGKDATDEFYESGHLNYYYILEML